MADVQVIRFLDQVSVIAIKELGGSPRRVRVEGDDFTQAEQVYLNGELSPFFEVKTPKLLVADVPDVLGEDTVTSVMVLSAHATLTEKSLLELTVGTRVQAISGIQKLLQTFMRLLLRTPGSSAFSPQSGGGIGRLIGQNYEADSSRLRSDAVAAVDKVRRNIITAQAAEQGIPLSERLLSAEAKGVEVSQEADTLALSVEVVSHSGQRGLATLLG